ncbi:hypothetical protein AVEN_263642-1 [Araneus ventricosus]|uniref:Uncharacterized protein n=1 Tax=Araneus ventricosus TaxID=182803 RepID=A0A4Y2ATN2_ARAVE|nr:hypothetical protein AVEN_263642-1 [Araneus ventricosus]
MWAWCTLNLTSWGKHPPAGLARKLGEEDASSDVVLVIQPRCLYTISVYRSRRNPESGTRVRLPSALRHHWGNAARPRKLCRAEIDGNRWEQDRDYRWDIKTRSSSPGTTVAVVACAAPHESERCRGVTQYQNDASHASCSNYHLFQHLKMFLARQHFPIDDDVQMATTRWLCSQMADCFDTGKQKLASRYNKCFNSGEE